MSHPVYLIIYHSPLFPAHWALYLPLPFTPSSLPVPASRFLRLPTPPASPSDAEPTEKRAQAPVNRLGKVVNVVGSVAQGFQHEFKRPYDLERDGRSYSLLLLDSAVASQWVQFPESDQAAAEEEGEGEDGQLKSCRIGAEAEDELERLALSVPAPGPTLRSAGQAGKRPQLRNCQTWLREAVEMYVEKGVMRPVALDRLAGAPMN